MLVTFDQLWQLASQEARRTGMTPRAVFQAVGLTLEWPATPWQYYCTPRNAKTFASTGSDGVHYSLLESPLLRYSPVIMTVPMSFENANIVVAETLHEFLCLGCRASYLGLEALAACDSDFRVLKQRNYDSTLSLRQVRQLKVLSEAFSLYPYVNLERRMAQLQAKYLDFLQMGEMELVSLKNAPAPAAFSFGQFA
ncbi:MAG: hypothetical protein AAFO84_09250 [Cyanobacteria bacterium J06598_1]